MRAPFPPRKDVKDVPLGIIKNFFVIEPVQLPLPVMVIFAEPTFLLFVYVIL